ncbi:hypothetical protein N2152v2_010758 [Parachlorella kessleri]
MPPTAGGQQAPPMGITTVPASQLGQVTLNPVASTIPPPQLLSLQGLVGTANSPPPPSTATASAQPFQPAAGPPALNTTAPGQGSFNLSSTVTGTNMTLGQFMAPSEIQGIFGGGATGQSRTSQVADAPIFAPSPTPSQAPPAPLGQPCRTDVINFARASGDVDLFLSFAAVAGWLGNLSDPQLAITLLIPTNDAINAFMAEQGLDTRSMLANLGKLKAVVAYHVVPRPLAYIDLISQTRPLATYLPGATLSARLLSPTEVEVQAAHNSARLLRSNLLLCRTVVHVIDRVLMSAANIQFVMPYDLALQGISTPPPSSLRPGQAPCAPSIADILRSHPNLSLATVLLQLGGWMDALADPALNVTLFAPNDQALLQGTAQLLQPGRQLDQKAMGEVIRSTPLLHLAGEYMLVPGAGGLSLTELQGLEGEWVATENPNHDLEVVVMEGEAGEGQGVGIMGDVGNTTARVVEGDLVTCGGSVVHVVDASVTANYTRQEIEAEVGPLPEIVWQAAGQDSPPQAGGQPSPSPPPPPAYLSAAAPAAPAAVSTVSSPAATVAAASAPSGLSSTPTGISGQQPSLASLSAAGVLASPPTGPSPSSFPAPPASTAAAANASTDGPGGGCVPALQLYQTAPEFQGFWNLILASKVQDLAPKNATTPTTQLTALAPLNSAVNSFLSGLDDRNRAALLASPRAVVALLAYHAILPPPLREADMRDGMVLPTLAMDPSGTHLPLTVHRSPTGPVRLEGISNSAAIIYPDIAVCEGIVHAVDAIILPVRVQAMDGASPGPAGETGG